jgi:hypothetical protein
MNRKDISFQDFAVEYLDMHVPDYMQAISDSVPTATENRQYVNNTATIKEMRDDNYRTDRGMREFLNTLWLRHRTIQEIRLTLALRAGIEVRGVKCSEVLTDEMEYK